MIYIKTNNEGLGATQWITSPSVYLDHWALMEISGSEKSRARFTKAMKDRGGTLVLSWWNLVEFSKVTEPTQSRQADELLHELAWNAYWINPDFFTVGKLELSASKDDKTPVQGDLGFLHEYVRSTVEVTLKKRALGSPSFFTAIQKIPRIRQQYEEVADDMVASLTRLRAEPTMMAAIRKPPKRGSYPRGTRVIARQLIARFIKDKSLKIDRNNVIDLTHAVVSVSYCDYVLLDGLWKTMVDLVRRQCNEAGVIVPIAKVFTKRSNGVDEFLAELESQQLS